MKSVLCVLCLLSVAFGRSPRSYAKDPCYKPELDTGIGEVM